MFVRSIARGSNYGISSLWINALGLGGFRLDGFIWLIGFGCLVARDKKGGFW